MPTTKRYLAIPILNRNFKRQGLVWQLADDVRLSRLDDGDLAAIHREGEDDISKLAMASQAIIYCDIDQEAALDAIRLVAEGVRFTLNVFRKDKPAILGFALEFAGVRRMRLLRVHDLSTSLEIFTPRSSTFEFKPSTSVGSLAAHFGAVRKVLASQTTALIAVERFNWCLLRQSKQDKIIDLAIALEALIPGRDELRFRFAMYNSLFAEPDPSKRLAAFKSLQTLYDARSVLVHGSGDSGQKSVTASLGNWESLVQLASLAINYHVLFCAVNGSDAWEEHLKSLALRTDGLFKGS